jgi:hypothetical protein
MSDERQQLIQQISALSDDELLRMVYFDSSQYRSEAINFAHFEINKRGIPFNQTNIISAPNMLVINPFVSYGKNIYILILGLIRTRTYIVFILGSLVLFIIANYHSYSHMYDNVGCFDCFTNFGFPFEWYTTGGFVGSIHIFWELLLANVLIASCFGICSGWIRKRLITRISKFK